MRVFGGVTRDLGEMRVDIHHPPVAIDVRCEQLDIAEELPPPSLAGNHLT